MIVVPMPEWYGQFSAIVGTVMFVVIAPLVLYGIYHTWKDMK